MQESNVYIPPPFRPSEEVSPEVSELSAEAEISAFEIGNYFRNNPASDVPFGLILGKVLSACHIESAFAVPGFPITDSLNLLRTASQVTLTICRSEQSAAFAAGTYGYLSGGRCYPPLDETNLSHSVLTGSPGVCITTSGPGFLAALPAIINSAVNKYPVILISSSAGVNSSGTEFQDFPQYALAKGCNVKVFKKAFSLECVEELGRCLAAARYGALSGVPGPVYVDIATPIWLRSYTVQSIPMPNVEIIPRALRKSACGSLVQACHGCKKPLFVLGKGLAYSGGPELARMILEEICDNPDWSVPLLPAPMAKGFIPDHSCNCVSACRSAALSDADLIVFFGATVDWMFAGSTNPNAKIFVVDTDPCACEHLNGKAELILADPAVCFRELILDREFRNYTGGTPWVASLRSKCEAAKAKLSILAEVASSEQGTVPSEVPISSITRDTSNRLSFRDALTGVNKLIKLNSLKHATSGVAPIMVIAEGAVSMDKSRIWLEADGWGSRIDAGTFGVMGHGTGSALGCSIFHSLARGLSTEIKPFSILIQGDSAFGFCGLEYETIGRYLLPVLIVVLDNGGVYAAAPGRILEAECRSSSVPELTRMDRIDVTDLTPGFQFANLWDAMPHVSKARTIRTAAELETAILNFSPKALPVLWDIKISPKDGQGRGFVEKKISAARKS